mmetsp:Transcript_7975/g.18486  ORF Transcript_7975/g.18486 Transcript_7975/m.18486 type:complete len:212 (-) Transcript_7975:175-810(-)
MGGFGLRVVLENVCQQAVYLDDPRTHLCPCFVDERGTVPRKQIHGPRRLGGVELPERHHVEQVVGQHHVPRTAQPHERPEAPRRGSWAGHPQPEPRLDRTLSTSRMKNIIDLDLFCNGEVRLDGQGGRGLGTLVRVHLRGVGLRVRDGDGDLASLGGEPPLLVQLAWRPRAACWERTLGLVLTQAALDRVWVRVQIGKGVSPADGAAALAF